MKHFYKQWALLLAVVISHSFPEWHLPEEEHRDSGDRRNDRRRRGHRHAGRIYLGQVGIDTMINGVPGIKDLANLKGEQISNVGSQDMSFDIMLKLAKRINELTSSGDVDGIVITHGTDTMEEYGVLPQPDREDRQAGCDRRLHEALDRGECRWSSEPL